MSKARVGRYEVERVLSERAGMVWLVGRAQEPPHAACLLQRITQQKGAAPFAYTRFLDRARAQARVAHAGVVRVLEVGTAGDDLLVAYSLTPGWSAEEMVSSCALHRHPLPLGLACAVMADALRGLEAAHTLSPPLVHGGLDLSVLRVTREGDGQVTGFARLHARQDARYRSPEELRGEAESTRSDLYTAGLLLYELLTGQPILAELPSVDVGDALRYAPLPDPRERNPLLPRRLSELVMQAVSPDPSLRPASAAEFARRLEVAAEPVRLSELERLEFLDWLQRYAPQAVSLPLPLPLAPESHQASSPDGAKDSPSPRAARFLSNLGGLLAVLALAAVGVVAWRELARPGGDEPLPAGPIRVRIPPPSHADPAEPLPLPAPSSNEKWVSLTLVTQPASQVYFRGKLLGKTPLFQAKLPVGLQEIDFALPDGKLRRLSLEVEDKYSAGYRLDLTGP